MNHVMGRLATRMIIILAAADFFWGIAAGETPVAWIRLDHVASEYKGTPYVFLGGGDIGLTLDAPLEAGQRIDLRWGAKNDTRVASLDVGGQIVALSHGGYDGFQWFGVQVPAGVRPGTKALVLRAAAGGKAAFIAEVRIVTPGESDTGAADLTARAHGIRLAQAATVEAFPQMRAMWDREPTAAARDESPFRIAEQNARRAAEGFYRCRRYVDGWLAHADPVSGLIPRNLTASRDLWNGRDSAADNYPYMVLTCALTDRALFEGRMRQMLETEIRITSRLGRLGDHYSFERKGFAYDAVDLDRLVFDNAEYVKDGLIPLTEWLGPSPWSERMVGLIDDIWANALVETPFGKVPTLNFEVNGDLLQACSRLFWFTGERKYLDWATRLGDYYLLGDHHPTRDMEELRLFDHGCEVVNGLSELYVAVSRAAPEKKRAYEVPLRAIYDSILEIGRNGDGLLYTVMRKDGTHSSGLCDTWGYNYDGFYTMYLVDGAPGYRDAVRHVLGNLSGKYEGMPWADRSADGHADSIEGAINLLNREPVPSAAEWVDRQIRLMWAIQKADGVIEGWHGDGNFARTTIMYCLWQTQGLHAEPWREDVRIGAVREGDGIAVSLAADKPWKGRAIFDRARHRDNMKLPIDYPRINQFPEWFVAEPGRRYAIRDEVSGAERAVGGQALLDGIEITLEPGVEQRWRVQSGP
ncbi:MAG TPA: hypothetical protein PLU30_27905 [Verrucomicrobiae bacterium]|nr:hypothetical protein [Verrucomicrobiae bacterium]